MRYIRHIISLTIFLTVSFFCYQLYKLHTEEIEKLNKQVEEIFWKAIQEDSDLRLDETNVPWVNVVASDHEIMGSPYKGGGATIRSKEGEMFIPYSAIEKPPKHLMSLFAQQSYLNIKNPLSAIRLDSMFNVRMKELLPEAITLIYCCNRPKGTVSYSGPDTVLCKSPVASPWIEVGAKRELLLRGYVGYPLIYIMKVLLFRVYPFLIMLLLLLVILGYFYYRLKKASNSVLLENNFDENKIEYHSSTDSTQTEEALPFYFQGKKIVSTNQNLLIFKLFLTKSDLTLEHQEIICALWGNKLFEYHQRLRKCMQRFREFLREEFPEAELVSIKGKGYRLHFPYEDEVPIPAPEPPVQENQPVV